MLGKLLSLASIAVLGSVLAAAPAQARTLDQIIQSGTIRVGVNPNFPPMSSYGTNNELEGFDVDVANKIAESLGVKVELVPTETAQRVPFLVADQIDISLGALTRTAERAKLIDFTVPLHTESMGVLTTDKVAATKWSDLDTDSVTLVNMRGNWSVDFLKGKLPKSQVLLVETNADTVRAIAQGRADALVENVDFFMAFTKNYTDVKWKTLNDVIFTNYDSIGVAKGNDGLRLYLNTVLYDLHSSEQINETWVKWYGQPMTVPVVANPFF
jgi:polar amino acid transport system substrate-binding protein